MSEHEHVVLPVERPADPKICACGKQRDPVTHAWLTPAELGELRRERTSRRARFGSDEVARAMNKLGL